MLAKTDFSAASFYKLARYSIWLCKRITLLTLESALCYGFRLVIIR